jgi:hypothetical protein
MASVTETNISALGKQEEKLPGRETAASPFMQHVSEQGIRVREASGLSFFACSVRRATAKRVPPKPVAPKVADGIRYSAAGDGKDSYVVATDEARGKSLWKVKVFHTRIKFWRGGEDNQWLFISDLELAGASLLDRAEKNRCYSICLNTKRVKKAPCGNIFLPQEPRR